MPVYLPGETKTSQKLHLEFVYEEARSGMFIFTLFEARGLRKVDPMGKQDPYVQFSIGEKYNKKSKTVKDSSTDPYFGEEDVLIWTDGENWINDLRVDILDDELGVDKVDRVVLAGAFGAHISPKHAMVLGMIPDAPLDKVTSAGNAAGHGARIALCNRAARTRIEAGVHAIHKVETAIEPRFQEHFVAANAIPHATDSFPDLAQIVTLPHVAFGASGGGGEDGGRRRRRRG